MATAYGSPTMVSIMPKFRLIGLVGLLSGLLGNLVACQPTTLPSTTTPNATPPATLNIYAAASMANALDEINALYQQQYAVSVHTSYASSGTLAKQIDNGAGADIFISADTQWMQYLSKKQRIIDSSQKNLLGNRLVLITPKNSPINSTIKMTSSFDIGNAFTGKLCTGNTQSVPVGRYAKQALTHLGWWHTIAPRLVETEDVRSALNFVNKGECQLGIVYATDAKIASNVLVVGTFPLASHEPIIYPIAMVKKTQETKRYYRFLQSKQAVAIYQKYGFSVL